MSNQTTEKTASTKTASDKTPVPVAASGDLIKAATAAPIFGHEVDIETMRAFKQPKIAISKLVFPDFDSRADGEEVTDDFVDSVRPGLWQPIVVAPIAGTDKFIIVAGRRRVKAFIKLARTEIAYTMPEGIVLKDAKDQAGIQAALQLVTISENAFRKGLNDWDKACTMLKQKQAGERQDAIAAMWGVKPPYVSQRLAMFNLAPPVQEMCKKFANDPGMFSKARKLAEVTDPEIQTAIAKDAFDPVKGFQVKDVDVLVDRFKAGVAQLQEKEKEREANAAAAAAAKASGKGEANAAAAAKETAKEEPKKDPYGETKAIPITIARKLLADHAAKVKKLVGTAGVNPEKLAFEKGMQAGLELAFGVKELPKAYTAG